MKFQMLVAEVARLHETAARSAGQAFQRILSVRNWLIGAYIVAFEQDGEDRAEYGAELLKSLAQALRQKSLAGGLSARNLRNFRQVALAFPECDRAPASRRRRSHNIRDLADACQIRKDEDLADVCQILIC